MLYCKTDEQGFCVFWVLFNTVMLHCYHGGVTTVILYVCCMLSQKQIVFKFYYSTVVLLSTVVDTHLY